MDKKQTFLMYKDWDMFISNLTDEQAGRLLKAVYAKENGRDAEVQEDISIIFKYISKKIEENEERYRAICEKRKEYGAIRRHKANASTSNQLQTDASISKHKLSSESDTDTGTNTGTDTMTGTDTRTGTDTGMDTDINNTDNMSNSIPEKDLDQVLVDLTQPKFIKIGR